MEAETKHANISALYNKGVTFVRLDDFAAAVSNNGKVLSIEPGNINALIRKGDTFPKY